MEHYDSIMYQKYAGNHSYYKEKQPFIEWFRTKYLGFCLSRLYSGNFMLEDVLQEFRYLYCPNSWADLEEKRRASAKRQGLVYRLNGDMLEDCDKMTPFNSSSFACQNLAFRIKASESRLKSKRNKKRQGVKTKSRKNNRIGN